MMQEFVFVIAGLFCFRLAQFIALDYGPGDISLKFRLWCARRSKFISKLISCPYCIGTWLALPIAALMVLFWERMTGIDIIVSWFALAGVQAFLQGIVDNGTN